MSYPLARSLREHAVTSADNLNHHSGAKFRKEEMIEWKAAVRIERLQAVADAARKDVYDEHSNTDRIACMCAVCIAIRDLDGKCPVCNGRDTVVRVATVSGESVDMDVDCPRCGHE